MFDDFRHQCFVLVLAAAFVQDAVFGVMQAAAAEAVMAVRSVVAVCQVRSVRIGVRCIAQEISRCARVRRIEAKFAFAAYLDAIHAVSCFLEALNKILAVPELPRIETVTGVLAVRQVITETVFGKNAFGRASGKRTGVFKKALPQLVQRLSAVQSEESGFAGIVFRRTPLVEQIMLFILQVHAKTAVVAADAVS